jgi:hypothetical protein
MKMRWLLTAIGCVATAMLACARPSAASEVLFSGVGFMQGQQSFEDSFALSGPGVLTVTLSDIAWPEPLANLDMVVSTPHGLLGPEVGAQTESYTLTQASQIYVQWFGTAQGPLDAGAYGLKVNFAPTAVPLPSSVLLLLSGLVMLVWSRRQVAARSQLD